MNNEYVIVNKSFIEKRIKELEVLYKNIEKPSIEGIVYTQLSLQLKKILSQSTPLLPEIEKAFDAGGVFCFNVNIDEKYDGDKQDYISNLKLDI